MNRFLYCLAALLLFVTACSESRESRVQMVRFEREAPAGPLREAAIN